MDTNIKFEDIELKIPSLKVTSKKLEQYTNELINSKTAKEGIKLIKRVDKLMDDFETKSTVIMIRYSLDTTNKEYIKAKEKIDEIVPLLSSYINRWNKALVNVAYKDELIKKYSSYYFKRIENSLEAFDDKIIPELIEENKLVSEYEAILGGANIEFRGQYYNLSQLGKFTTSKDRLTRLESSVKIDEFFYENSDKIGQIYDRLVHLRDTMAKKLGYENYIELAYKNLGRVDYKAKDVEIYRSEIAKNVIPLCNKLYKEQANRIHIPLKKMYTFDYNLSFLSGNPKVSGDTSYLIKKAQEMYNDMGKITGEFFNFMVDRHLLDLDARAGKQPGGYMTYLPNYQYPFIFSNFNGTKGDVDVLTHEVGHAFQGYLSKDIKPSDFRSPTLETCEIHSMSMEFFAYPYMELFFDKDADKYRYSHLEEAIEFLPYGITIDEFQHWVYTHVDATHEERCKAFKEIEGRYTPHKRYHKDFKCFSNGGYWLRQSHIFGTPFYYIDYTLAQVCAFQFLNKMNKDKDKAFKQYEKLCRCGGKYPFVENLERNHLLNPFKEGNLKKIINPLKKILKDIDTTGF